MYTRAFSISFEVDWKERNRSIVAAVLKSTQQCDVACSAAAYGCPLRPHADQFHRGAAALATMKSSFFVKKLIERKPSWIFLLFLETF